MSYCDGLFSAGAALLSVCKLYRVFRRALKAVEGSTVQSRANVRARALKHRLALDSFRSGGRLVVAEADLSVCRDDHTSSGWFTLWHVLTSSPKWCCSLMESVRMQPDWIAWARKQCGRVMSDKHARGSKVESASH